MPKQNVSRHRRSVALMPEAKSHVDRIVAVTGVSANRAIEQAVEFYSKCLNLKEDGQIVAFTIKTPQGNNRQVEVLV